MQQRHRLQCDLLSWALGWFWRSAFAVRAHAAPVTFDFEDVPTTALSPFTYMVGGITATFSSAADPGAFFVGEAGGAYLTLTGHGIADSFNRNDTLVIRFSVPLSVATFAFATNPGGDLHVATALGGAPGATSVFTGTVPDNFVFPEGVVTLSGLFDTITIQDVAEPSFSIDNLVVTSADPVLPVPAPSFPVPVLAAMALLAARRRRRSRSSRDPISLESPE